MPTDLNGWHPGEQAIQTRLNVANAVALNYTWIENGMPDEHRNFHSQNLQFVPLTTLDASGRPWSSLVTGSSGEPGFISSPSDSELELTLQLWAGDPILRNLELPTKRQDRKLIAGLGIEFATRRRNKFAGWVTNVDWLGGNAVRLRLHVNQAIGNCPKYINARKLVTEKCTVSHIIYNKLHLDEAERLHKDVVDLIQASDTVFLGTSYEASSQDENKFPSHVGMNQRGGRKGFVRVSPSDARTIVLPDYSGNRLMTSLGNIEATPLASLTFVAFETGDVLYTTGAAKTLVDEESLRIMPRQPILTTLRVTGFVLVRGALPVRQKPNSVVEQSPYSPPVKFLAEEQEHETALEDTYATLQKVKILSPSLATFTFGVSRSVQITPGQTAIMDFTDLMGKRGYQHMAFPGKESSINDDRIRTWTVSSAHTEPAGTDNFSLTMRLKRGGLVTGALFTIAQQLEQQRPDLLVDSRPLGLRVKLLGIGGNFVLPSNAKKLLWIAGGIGATPFLSMLSSLKSSESYDVIFILSTREPDVLLPLIFEALSPISDGLKLKLYVFSDLQSPSIQFPDSVGLHYRLGRIPATLVADERLDVRGRTIYVCGPPLFEEQVLGTLDAAGVDRTEVKREGFMY